MPTSTPPRLRRSTDRVAVLRARLAQAALVIVFLGVSVFAVYASSVTSRAATTSADATRLADQYTAAVQATAAQESLERKYRLEPAPSVRAAFDAAAHSLQVSLSSIVAQGDAADQLQATSVRTAQHKYLQHMQILFAAVDRGDDVAVFNEDREGDVIFHAMQSDVLVAASRHNQQAQEELTVLQDLQSRTQSLTPLVFVVGLLLAAALSFVTRGHRKLLASERAQAVYAAAHDHLTGLPNRTLLADQMERSLAGGRRQPAQPAALLLMDLDRFKDINDTFGHHFGDLVLSQIGPRLTAALGPHDVLARLGGDEFAILLVGVGDPTIASATADRLRNVLHRPFIVHEVSVDVDVSIGVSVSGVHGDNPDALLRCADIAMYEAKQHQVGVMVYDPSTDRHTPAKLALLGDLRRALQTDELQLHYQPKFDLSTGQVSATEALIRWQHPQRGLLMPDDFIPLAEQTGLIDALTRHVIVTAAQQARSWMDRGVLLPIAVNLSARNLHDETLPSLIADVLKRNHVSPSLLQVEVTESALTVDAGQARRLLIAISAAGIKVSIDDFGAGYTSIGQLKDLPISELKIDRSFIHTMSERTDRLIVRSIIDLGHELGLTIVAEGVESADDLLALTAYGCDTAQGYHLARPMPPETFDIWYTGHRESGLLLVAGHRSPPAARPNPSP